MEQERWTIPSSCINTTTNTINPNLRPTRPTIALVRRIVSSSSKSRRTDCHHRGPHGPPAILSKCCILTTGTNIGIASSAASEAVFDEDWIRDLSLQITNGLQSRVEWLGLAPLTDGEDSLGVRLLDYACGNGLVSKVNYSDA
jgi:hypothetical protein